LTNNIQRDKKIDQVRGNIVANKFNHMGEILALKEGFPKYFEAYTSIKIQWGDDFAENNFRNTHTTGKGKDEKLELSTKILIESKDIPVTFIENAEGALDIKVYKKTIYTIKPRGRISQDLLFAFTRAIIKEQP
jgi:hypothetical protein